MNRPENGSFGDQILTPIFAVFWELSTRHLTFFGDHGCRGEYFKPSMRGLHQKMSIDGGGGGQPPIRNLMGQIHALSRCLRCHKTGPT